MNKKQMDAFLNEIVEEFNGKEFSIEDIKNLDTFIDKKKKKKKDPNAPKRASSAWIFYTSEKRPQLQEENSDKKMTELTTIMSEMWRNLTDEEKKPYKDMETKDRERYKLEMEEYVENSDTNSDTSDSDTGKKKKKDPDAPKRNIGAMQHFCKVYRSKNSENKYTLKILRGKWEELEDKSEYEQLALEDKERYQKEKAEYQESE
jgi:high mobility group protein B2